MEVWDGALSWWSSQVCSCQSWGWCFCMFHAVATKLCSRTRNSQFGLLGQILYAQSPWCIDGGTNLEYFGLHLVYWSLDTPCMSHTEWYCPPVPSNAVPFLATASHLKHDVSWFSVAKKAHTCWGVLPSSLKLDRTFQCINKSLPSHYNSLCFCKLFVPESAQVHSHIPNHCATYWLNFNLNTMSSWSFCITQSSEADMSDLTRYLSQKMLCNDK